MNHSSPLSFVGKRNDKVSCGMVINNGFRLEGRNDELFLDPDPVSRYGTGLHRDGIYQRNHSSPLSFVGKDWIPISIGMVILLISLRDDNCLFNFLAAGGKIKMVAVHNNSAPGGSLLSLAAIRGPFFLQFTVYGLQYSVLRFTVFSTPPLQNDINLLWSGFAPTIQLNYLDSDLHLDG
jgi:hypothetical protein